jgi:hypothetical protein
MLRIDRPEVYITPCAGSGNSDTSLSGNSGRSRTALRSRSSRTRRTPTASRRGGVIGAMSRHEIQVLRGVGMAQAAVAAKAGVSKASVRRIEREVPVTTSERSALVRQPPSRPAVDRHAVGTGHRDVAGRRPGTAERRDRAPAPRRAGYAGGKSAVYELVRSCGRCRSPRWCASRVAGEFSQHDFGQIDVRYTGGGRERIRFFASRRSGAASPTSPWCLTSGKRRSSGRCSPPSRPSAVSPWSRSGTIPRRSCSAARATSSSGMQSSARSPWTIASPRAVLAARGATEGHRRKSCRLGQRQLLPLPSFP